MGPLDQLLDWQWRHLKRRDLWRITGGALLAGTSLAHGADNQVDIQPDIWVSHFREKNVWGYVNKHSVFPGEPFELMLSTGPACDLITGHVEVFRVEPLSVAGGQSLIWRSLVLQVSHRSVLRTAAAIGVHWPPALTAVDTTDWPPGYYSMDFVDDVSGVRDLQIAQIVIRNPHRSGAILFKLCTNTYQAYNAWGGHSLYPSEADGRGAMVSFDRPTGPAFFEYDVYLARWLEEVGNRNGFAIDYASNFDVHQDPDLIERYPLVATGAHDEYWTKEEFDAFERRIFRHGKIATLICKLCCRR
jgi:hypothetical protein